MALQSPDPYANLGIGLGSSRQTGDQRDEKQSVLNNDSLYPILPDRDVLEERRHARRLRGTSKGSQYDLPPEKWIRKELVEHGAIGL